MAKTTTKSVVAKQAPTPTILAECGDTGLKRSGGILTEEFLTTLAGPKAIKVYREMSDNDPLIGGALLAIETLIRQAPFSAEPASSKPEAHREAEFIDECRDDMEHTWSEFMSEVLSVCVYGFAWHEEVYKLRRGPNENGMLRSRYDDGRWAWRKLAPRSQDSLYRWEFDESSGDILGMHQYTQQRGVKFIPLSKSLLFRLRSRKNSPEGRSLLRSCVRPWWFARRIEEYEAIGVQKDMAGLPKMELPPEVMAPNPTAAHLAIRNTYENMIPRLARGEYEALVLPHEQTADGKWTGYRFSLVANGGRRPADVNEILKRLDSRKLIALLAEFLVLGMDKVGSFALSSDKTDLFALAVRAIIDAILEVLNRVAIPRLMQLNGVHVDLWPRLKVGDLERRSIMETAQYIQTLTAAGHLAPHDKLDAHLLEIADLPARERPAEIDLGDGQRADEATIEAMREELRTIVPFEGEPPPRG